MSEGNGKHEKSDGLAPGGSPGGMGGGSVDRRDLTLYRRAAKQGWDIPEVAFTIAPQECLDVLQDEDAGRRDKFRAIQALGMMNGQNQQLEPSRHLHLHGHADLEGLSSEELEAIARGELPDE